MLSACVLTIACGKKEEPPPSTNTGPPSSGPISVPNVPTDGPRGIDTLEGADTSPKSAVSAGGEITHLTDVRVARHEGFDRIVFSFAGELPGYTIEYVKPPILSDGAGEPVAVAGRHFVQARMNPASGVDLSDPELRVVYTGPARVSGDTAIVREVVRTGDFEAYLTWAVGLEDKVDFRVSKLSNPSRLALDFRNH